MWTPEKNASRMPLCMESPNNRVVTYTGRSLKKWGGRQKQVGNHITEKSSVFNIKVMVFLFCNSRAQDLCAEEGTLGLLDDLLVNRLRGVVHDDSALLVIDLGVNPGVANKVDNPLLTLVLVQTETSGKVPSKEEHPLVCYPCQFPNINKTYLMSIRWWILQ